jgi:hypothetical protein
LRVHGDGQDLKILVSVSFVKFLPDRQLLPARSPRGPRKDQDPVTAEVAQTNGASAIERLDREVRGRPANSAWRGSIYGRLYQNQRQPDN